MVSPKQRAASRANSLRSTGPRSSRGKSQAKLNATKHGLSLPVDERVFEDLIQEISTLIRDDCKSDSQAYELAKRIIDFERNEIFLEYDWLLLCTIISVIIPCNSFRAIYICMTTIRMMILLL